MRSIHLLPAAEIEIMEARDWYETAHAGSGSRFIAEVRYQFRYQLGRIADHPERFRLVRRDARCGRLRVFPYVIVFREDEDGIFVLACFHTRRNPAVWQSRT